MNIRNFAIIGLAYAGVGCSAAPPEELLGVAEARLESVPTNVRCVTVEVAGAQTVLRVFDVVPTQSAVLRLDGLPSGSVTFRASAFDAVCSNRTGLAPSWVGGAVGATLTSGQTAHLSLQLKPNTAAGAQVTIDFADASSPVVPSDAATSPDGGTCVVSACEFTGLPCCSGYCTPMGLPRGHGICM